MASGNEPTSVGGQPKAKKCRFAEEYNRKMALIKKECESLQEIGARNGKKYIRIAIMASDENGRCVLMGSENAVKCIRQSEAPQFLLDSMISLAKGGKLKPGDDRYVREPVLMPIEKFDSRGAKSLLAELSELLQQIRGPGNAYKTPAPEYWPRTIPFEKPDTVAKLNRFMDEDGVFKKTAEGVRFIIEHIYKQFKYNVDGSQISEDTVVEDIGDTVHNESNGTENGDTVAAVNRDTERDEPNGTNDGYRVEDVYISPIRSDDGEGDHVDEVHISPIHNGDPNGIEDGDHVDEVHISPIRNGDPNGIEDGDHVDEVHISPIRNGDPNGTDDALSDGLEERVDVNAGEVIDRHSGPPIAAVEEEHVADVIAAAEVVDAIAPEDLQSYSAMKPNVAMEGDAANALMDLARTKYGDAIDGLQHVELFPRRIDGEHAMVETSRDKLTVQMHLINSRSHYIVSYAKAGSDTVTVFDPIALKPENVHLHCNHETKAQLLISYKSRMQLDADGHRVLQVAVSHENDTQSAGDNWSCGYRSAAIMLELLANRDVRASKYKPKGLPTELLDMILQKQVKDLSRDSRSNRIIHPKKHKSTMLELCSDPSATCQDCLCKGVPTHLTKKTETKDDWVNCTTCHNWWHAKCAGVSEIVQARGFEYVCERCQVVPPQLP